MCSRTSFERSPTTATSIEEAPAFRGILARRVAIFSQPGASSCFQSPLSCTLVRWLMACEDARWIADMRPPEWRRCHVWARHLGLVGAELDADGRADLTGIGLEVIDKLARYEEGLIH